MSMKDFKPVGAADNQESPEYLDDFQPIVQPQFGFQPVAQEYSNPETKDEGKGITGHAKDLGISALKGAIAVPEMAVGLADIATGGRAGKFLENEGGAIGFRPGQAKEMLSDLHTDQYKAQQQEFANADGVMDKAGVAVQNPSLIANTVVESLPSVGAGGVIGRGLTGATRLGQMGLKGQVAAGAIGEGATMAGMQAEGIRQQTDDGLLTPEQSALSLGTGVLGTLFSIGGGRLAQKLGVGDIDTLAARGALNPADVAGEIANMPAKSIPRKVIEGAVTEGLLEELPQSVSEQILQNLALDKDWSEGVDDAAVMGTLAGMVMGGPAGAFSGNGHPATGDTGNDADQSASDMVQPEPTPENPSPAPVERPDPANGPLSSAAAKLKPVQTAEDLGVQFPDEQQDWSQYEQAAANRGVQAERGFDGLDGLIATTERMGFTDEAAQLITARRLFQQANKARASGDEAMADQYTKRANDLYESATKIMEPGARTGEIVTGGEIGPHRGQSEPRGETYDAENIIYGEEPDYARAERQQAEAAREQRQADDFSARYGQEGQARIRPEEGEYVPRGTITDEDRMLPNQYQRTAQLEDNRMDALPEGTGQMDMGRDRPERTFTPVPDEYEGVGRNVVERQASIQTPQLENMRTITQDQMIELTRQFRQAVTTKPADRTEEQKQLIKAIPKIKQKVNSGEVELVESSVEPLTPDLHVKKNGKPFSAESFAKASAEYRNNKDYAEVVPVEGGFAIRVDKARQKEEQRTGKQETTYLPDNTPIKTRFVAMDLDELVPSNTPDGRVNQNYPQELQPRDRTNANSQVQVRNISAELNPERLGSSRDASTGAPIVGPDGVVESGNGRTMAIATAYQQGGDRAAAYRNYVIEQARQQGMDADAVSRLKQPVLVRERINSIDRAEFARRANESQVAGMTAYEQAMSDADRLATDDLQLWEPDQSGDPLAASNRDFQRTFVRMLGNNEAARYTTRGGQASPELGARMQRAVFAKAYRDADMVEMVTEQSEHMRNLVAALQEAAPDLAIAAEYGTQETANAIKTINDAVRLVRKSRQGGVGVQELTRQNDAFSDPIPAETAFLAEQIYLKMRSRRALTEAMRYIGQAVRREAETNMNGSLFGDSVTNEDIFNAAFRENQADSEGQQQADGDLSGGIQESGQNPGDGGQGAEPETGFAEAEVEPLLQSYTEEDIRAREQAQTAEEARIAEEQRKAEQRAQADTELNDFRLSGSNSPADIAAAGGQSSLFGASGQPTQEQPSSQTIEPQASQEQPGAEIELSRTSVDTFNSWKRQGLSVGTKKGWTIFKDDRFDQYVLMRKTLEENAAGGGYEGVDSVHGFNTRAQAEEWIESESKKQKSVDAGDHESTTEQAQANESPDDMPDGDIESKPGYDTVSDDVLEDVGLLRERRGRWQYRNSPQSGWMTSNTKEGAVEMATSAYWRTPESERLTREQRNEKAAREEFERMDRIYGKMSRDEIEQRIEKMGGDIAGLQQAAKSEINDGRRRTGAAVAAEAARQTADERMRLERYYREKFGDTESTTGQPPVKESVAGAATEPAANAITWKKDKDRKIWRSSDGQIITDESFTTSGVKTRFFPVYASDEDRQSGNNYASGESLAEAKSKAVPVKQTSQQPESGSGNAGSSKLPWQMTRSEWDLARERIRPNNAQSNYTSASKGEAVSRGEALDNLLYGVNDDARETLRKAASGEIELSKDEAEALLEKVNSPVTHRDVIEKAVREGKKVPDSVIEEYPDLKQATATPEVNAEPGNEINDAGEKIGGARKDELRTARERLDSMDDQQIAASTMSKLWPKNEIDKIEDPVSAAIYHTARSMVPNKPRAGYKIKRWVEQVKQARDILNNVNEIGAEGFLNFVRGKGGSLLRPFADRVELLAGIDRAHWDRIGHVIKQTGRYNKDGEMVPGDWFNVTIDGARETFYGKSEVAEIITEVKEFLAGKEVKKPGMKFEIRRVRSSGKFQINKTGDKEYRTLKEFDDLTLARNYLKNNNADLVEAWEAVKRRDNVSKSDVRGKKNASRVGPDYRNGKDITPDEFLEAFGFRGVEFGNWVKQGKSGQDRQGLLNNAYDAFMDLAGALGLPPKALSLDGRLGIGFGSRGRGGTAAAHFEPGLTVINLTKNKGAGSLAHEWFHALDNYFSKKRGDVEFTGDQDAYRESAFVTYRPEPMMVYTPSLKTGRPYRISKAEYNRRKGNGPEIKDWESQWIQDPDHPKGIRPEVEKAFAELVETLNSSPMTERAKVIDKGKSNGYWSRIIERAARSFETYVIDKLAQDGYRNDFLANVVSFEKFSRNPNRYPYLKPDEQGPVSEAFDKLFSTIETKPAGDGNVVMFSRLDEDNTVDPEYTPGKANPFWEGLNNGALRRGSGNSRQAQKAWVEERITAGHGFDRGRPRILAGTPGGGRETIFFSEGIAGFQAVITDGRVTQNESGQEVFTLRVMPPDLMKGGANDSSSILTITLKSIDNNEYEVGILGPIQGGAAAQALTGTEYLSDTGNTSYQGLKYLKLNIGNAATKSFLSEAVRRLAMHNGRAPDAVLYSARDTGARAGDQTVRKFGRDIIESKFSRETEAESFDSMVPNDIGSSISRDQVEAIATRITANWANAPEMVTVATDLDLPADMQERIDKQNARGKIDGVFHKGRFYLIADKIRTEADVERIVLHEALGHYGLRQLYGPAFGMHMDRLFNRVGGYPGIQRLGKKYGFDLSSYWENAEDMSLAERREMMADELIAHIAGTGTVEPDLIQRIAHLVRKGLRKLMAGTRFADRLNQMTDVEVLQIVAAARKAVVEGESRITVLSHDPRFVRDFEKVVYGEERFSRVPDDAPVIETDGGTIAKGKTVKEMALRAREYARKHFAGRTFQNENTGDEIILPMAGVRHTLAGARADLIKSVAVTPEIIKQGVYLGSRPEEKGNPSVLAHHYYGAKIKIDGRMHDVVVDVREMADGKRYYDHAFERKTGSESTAPSNARNPNPVEMDTTTSTDSIEDDQDVRFSRTESSEFAKPEETHLKVALRKMADKFQVLKDLQKNIQEAGGMVDESNDAYLAEELFHGKTEEDLRQMRETFIKPLADKMAKFGIEQKDLDQYLYAKHAPERNAHIAEINPELQEAGSGMSDAKAAEILQQVRESGKLEQYEQLAGMVYDMLETRRETMRSAGLEADGMIDAWENKYEFYVPLKGWAVDEQQDSMARTGSGFNIAGKESKRAMGRSSEAASPSSYAIQDLTETLIRRRKNEVGNALLKLVEDNPNPGYWQVFTNENPDMDRQIFRSETEASKQARAAAKKAGQPEPARQYQETVRETPIPMAMMSDKYFQTKRDGQTYYIKLEDERLMKAMKNIGPDTSNFFIRKLGAVNRVLSALNTSYNPEFVVGNFARDVQTAVLNLMAEQTRDDGKALGEKIAKQTVKDIPKAMKAVYRGLRNMDEAKGGEWQKWFNEFREAGAKTGWFDMKDIDGQAADLQSLISMSKGGVKGNAMKWFKATSQFVEDLNGAVENAVRLSAYVNARKAGISKAKAASLAKNMTVNFNRRGEVGTTLNALYMFANASIQGSMNFARTMIGLKGQKGDPIWKRLNTAQKVAAGLVIGSYAIAMMNRAGAGEDDDGENWYDKVPDYVKERNLVIMKSLFGGEQDGSYWTIPLPYGYNIFHVLGNALEGTTNGNTSIGEAATDLTLATLGSFSPIGFQDSESLSGLVMRNVTPTLGKPIADIVANENFMGTSIYNENFPFGTPRPESQLGRRSTPEGYKAIAEFLNEVSGGSQWRSGYIDINPDVMRYVANYFTGAAGKFVFDKAPNNIYHLATLTPIESREALFWSRISGRVLPYEDREKFYNRRDEINQIEAEWKGLKGGDRIRFYRDNRKMLALRPLIQSTEKQLKALRQQRDRIYALDLPRKQQEARMEVIEARMKRVIDRFNREYARATGGD